MGMLLSAAVIAVSPLAGVFFKSGSLVHLMWLASLQLPLNATTMLPPVRLLKEMRFRQIAVAQSVGSLMQGVTTLTLAYHGEAYWSLVIGTLVGGCVRSILLWSSVAARPVPNLRFALLVPLWAQGGQMLVQRVLWFVIGSLDTFLLGRLGGQTVLGSYSLAKNLSHSPLDQLAGIVNQVSMPAFAAKAGDTGAQSRGLLLIVSVASALVFPFFWVGGVLSQVAFPLIFGSRWTSLVAPFMAFTCVLPARCLYALLDASVIGMGRFSTTLKNALTWAVILDPAATRRGLVRRARGSAGVDDRLSHRTGLRAVAHRVSHGHERARVSPSHGATGAVRAGECRSGRDPDRAAARPRTPCVAAGAGNHSRGSVMAAAAHLGPCAIFAGPGPHWPADSSLGGHANPVGITHRAVSPKSGVHLRSYHLLRGVAARHDVDLIAFVQEAWLDVFFDSREEGLQECRRALGEFCRSVRFLPIESAARVGGKCAYRTCGLAAAVELYHSLVGQRQRAPHICRSGSHAGLCAGALRYHRPGPLPRAVQRHGATLGHQNIESHMLLRRAENETSRMRRLYYLQEGKRIQTYEKQTADRFALHITCSDLDSQRLREIAPAANVVTIPNGVDLEYFRAVGAHDGRRSLIFVGSLNWYPNVSAVEFLLKEIWPPLRQAIPDLTLEIVGSAPPRSLVELAAALPGVTVHGFVDDVRPLMDAATLYVCPIRDGGGTKLKLLDAFAIEKCVIAHPVACAGIEVTPGKDVELAESAQSFVAAIRRLLEQPERRRQVGSAARALVEQRYRFAGIGKRLCDAFERG